ncbi:histidine kinase [Ruania suaedae]|uniref:sensor histidine kinase n=1 Tax=Ruania suaedae TaxID=2897774 RepID=UPI001E4EAC60|nr:histidine kinase [Ruania suaedae]UFU03289.1 histidine kinase [Ruania suaedae]
MQRWMEVWRGRLRGTPRRQVITEAVAVTVVGLALHALGVGPVLSDAPLTAAPHWHLPLLLTGGLILLAKRQRPVAALGAGAAVFVLDLLIGGSLGVTLVLIDLLYTLALHGSALAVRRLVAGTAMLLAAVTVLGWALLQDLRAGLLLGLQAFAVLATPTWWGTSVRRQAELAGLASARATDRERLARMEHEEALRDEREQMARDLHDAVAGNLSAIALHAEAGLARPAGDPATHQALGAVRSSSRSALAEMRTMIHLLRGGSPERSATGLSDRRGVEELVAAHRGTVSLPDLPRLPTAVDQTAFRLLQEALTNATKHGTGSPEAQVALARGCLELVVRNEARRVEPEAGGLGLEIMAERACAVGGSCTAGLEGPGGTVWTVRARLPIEEET